MLGEVTSEEISEWMGYFSAKAEYEKNSEAAEEAKARAKKNNG